MAVDPDATAIRAKPGLQVEHELHGRRKGRNTGVFFLLAGLVAIVFGLTVVKVLSLEDIREFETFDHVMRPQLVPGQTPATDSVSVPQTAPAIAPATAPSPEEAPE